MKILFITIFNDTIFGENMLSSHSYLVLLNILSLETKSNMTILSIIKGVPNSFSTEFKLEVFEEQTNQIYHKPSLVLKCT